MLENKLQENQATLKKKKKESNLNWKKTLSVIMYSTGKGFLQAKGQVEFGIKSHVSWLFAACWTIKKAELDHKEGWALKNWCFQTVSPLDSKEIKPVTPKGNHPWIFIGWTDAEALKLWPLDAKSWLIGKDPDAGKDWRQKEKHGAEDEMVR